MGIERATKNLPTNPEGSGTFYRKEGQNGTLKLGRSLTDLEAYKKKQEQKALARLTARGK